MSETEAVVENPLPDGDYAIVECLGHRTLIGRIAEVERFGTKLCQVESVFGEALLPSVLVGGASIYALTPCSRDVAWARRPRHRYQLPPTLEALLPPEALPAPEFPPNDDASDDEEEDQF